MRFTKSFLLSLNLHIWGIGLVSVVWLLSKPEPPEHVEVKYIKLPRQVAVVEGESGVLPELVGVEEAEVKDRSRIRSSSRSSSRSPHALRALGRQKTPRSRQRDRVPNGPTVEYRVRIAKQQSDQGVVQSNHSISPQETVVDDIPQTAGHRARQPADEVSFKGDTRPLLEIIQARIDAVTPLAHASAPGCIDQSGIVKIAFLIDALGYPCGLRIMKSSGSPCLDQEVDNVLHLAEPYPYVAGWVPVTVRFTL